MTDTLKEIWASLTNNVSSRVSSPFFGAFLVAWLLCNWDKLALLLFGIQSVDSRVSVFQDSIAWVSIGHENSFSTLWWPLTISCIYMFLGPYLHIAIQQIQKHSAGLRYSLTVDQDVDKEDARGRLVKAKAKADLQNKVAEDEVRAAIENSVAETKTLQMTAASAEARNGLIQEKYLEAQEKVKELKLANEVLERKEAKKSQDAEKATFAFEKSKAEHENELLTLRFPLAYQYMNSLSDSLSDDDWRCSLSNLSKIIANVFGYESFEKLINDESFSAKNIKKVKYLSYDSETLFDCLSEVIESENEDNDDTMWLFEHIQMTLDQYSMQLIDLDSVAEEAIEELWDGLHSDILDSEAVISEMAITNAHFDDVDDLQKESHRWVSGEGLYIRYSCTVSGESDPEKVFSGDTIYVDFEVKHPLVVGNSGLGAYEIHEVKARGKDYYDES
ncbi:hypothetical protein [Vibrio mediterranei]|uniref:hypothetical protein n=1 Tax=Vibrio mediterranei TaxID=689 RepID=UPI00148C93B0|nr:hypothetical protein [Vibrio mediterranei]NOI25946.1 hypothetical protein [Vibrio mediterranei]